MLGSDNKENQPPPNPPELAHSEDPAPNAVISRKRKVASGNGRGGRQKKALIVPDNPGASSTNNLSRVIAKGRGRAVKGTSIRDAVSKGKRIALESDETDDYDDTEEAIKKKKFKKGEFPCPPEGPEKKKMQLFRNARRAASHLKRQRRETRQATFFLAEDITMSASFVCHDWSVERICATFGLAADNLNIFGALIDDGDDKFVSPEVLLR